MKVRCGILQTWRDWLSRAVKTGYLKSKHRLPVVVGEFLLDAILSLTGDHRFRFCGGVAPSLIEHYNYHNKKVLSYYCKPDTLEKHYRLHMKKKLVLQTAVLAAAFNTPFLAQTFAQEEGALPSAAPALADASQGKTITSVEIRYIGSGRVDESRIRSRVSLKEGTAYSKDKEEADIKSLIASGDVENVSINTVESKNGVRITLSVEARAGLGDVTFLGNSAVSSDKLRTVIDDFKTGKSVDNAKLQTATKEIEDYYKKKGFTDVTVNYTVEPAANGFSRVVFKIDEGQSGKLRDVTFEGNNGISSKELRKVMKADDRGWMFWSAAKVEQEKMESDIQAIETHYRDKGYVNARVTGMEKVRVDDKRVDIVVRISEGEIFSVSSVAIAGAKAYDPNELVPAFHLASGKTFSEKDLKADVKTIKSFYGSRGYADIRVTPAIKNSGVGQVSVTYNIEEGSIYKVNEIRFTGNEKTRDSVMRRELAIIPGETYNQNTIDISERRLRGLGYFKDVSVLPSDANTPGYKDLSINVIEQQTGSLNFGAGFSSIDNLVGFVDLRQSNFDIGSWPPVGAGQRFNANLKIGTRRKDITVGWYEPWLLGNPLGFGVDAFYTEKTYLSDYYDQTNFGADIYFRKKINENSDLRLQLLSENVTIDGVEGKKQKVYKGDSRYSDSNSPDGSSGGRDYQYVDGTGASQQIQNEAGDYLHNEVTLTYNYDSRDDNILPRKGMKFSADLSGAFGDVQDVGFALNFSKPWHLPLDMIFTINASYERVEGSDVPIFERTFLGGANNMRGFKYRDVGPKDGNGEPLGGDQAWFVSGEVTFPIMERVRGATFVDVGAVSGGLEDTVGGGTNSDFGFGLRLNLPIFGPLKLDYGIPIQADEYNDGAGRFNISVDYKF